MLRPMLLVELAPPVLLRAWLGALSTDVDWVLLLRVSAVVLAVVV